MSEETIKEILEKYQDVDDIACCQSLVLALKHFALKSQCDLFEARAENARLREALTLARDELTGTFYGSWGHTMAVVNAALTRPADEGEA